MLAALKDHFFLFAYWWQKDSGRFDLLLMERRINGLSVCSFHYYRCSGFSSLCLFFCFFFLHECFVFSPQHHHHLDHTHTAGKSHPHKQSLPALFRPLNITQCWALNQTSSSFFNSLKSFSIRAVLPLVGEGTWKCSTHTHTRTLYGLRGIMGSPFTATKVNMHLRLLFAEMDLWQHSHSLH